MERSEQASQPTLPDSDSHTGEVHSSRWRLVWDVIVFQFRLALDGLRDVLLSPLSIGAALLGLVAGGNDPYRYFRRLQDLGHRSDDWINLFGHRGDSPSDQFVDGLRERVFTEASSNPWLSAAGSRLNAKLDDVNRGSRSSWPPPDDAPDPSERA